MNFQPFTLKYNFCNGIGSCEWRVLPTLLIAKRYLGKLSEGWLIGKRSPFEKRRHTPQDIQPR
jgi:hypothetical protein